jgi:hypothetical protein
MIGSSRKLLSEKRHKLHSSPNIIRMIKVKEYEMGRKSTTNEGEDECMQNFGRKETTMKT